MHIHSWIALRIVAAHDVAVAQAGAGEAGIWIQPCSLIRGNGPCRAATHNGICFRQGDSYTVRPGNRQSAFSYKLKHFVEDEVLQFPNIGLGVVTRLRFVSAPLPNLFVQG